MPDKNGEIQEQLIKKAIDGDQKAMYRLYKLYVQAMYNICIRMVPNRFDAEDLVQETFISAFNKLDDYRGDASFGAWIKRIAINKSLNFLRKKKVEFTGLEQVKSYTTENEDMETNNIPPGKIHEAIKLLPDKARVILNLYLLEGYKHKEIAGMLNISESTSKSQYQRAKELLRDKLKNEISYES